MVFTDGRSKRRIWSLYERVEFGHLRIKMNFEFAKLGRFHFFNDFNDLTWQGHAIVKV